MTVPTLVVALDLVHKSDHVVDTAMDLAQKLDARVCLVHAMALASGVRKDTLLSVPGRDATTAAELLEADARKHIQPLIDQLEGEGIPTQLVLGYDDPCELIGATAREQWALMVLVGAPKAGRLGRFWGKDLTTAILGCCNVPVLLVPRGKATAGDAYSTAQFQLLAETDG